MVENEHTLKPMFLGDILDYSIEVYKKNIKQLTLLTLIMYIPFIFMYTLAVSYISGQFTNFSAFFGDQPNTEDFSSGIYMFLAYYLIIMVLVFLYLIYTLVLKPVLDAAIIKVVFNDVVSRKEQKLKAIVRESFRKFASLFVCRLLYYLIIIGVGIGVFIILFFFMMIFMVFVTALPQNFGGAGQGSVPASYIMAAVIIILYLILIFGILLLFAYFTVVKFGFGIHSVVVENRRAAEGLSRSWQLTKKSFWHVFLAFIFGYVLSNIIPLILSAAAYFLIGINKSLYILANTAAQVLGALIYPFLITLTTMVFLNLKIKKEGYDLELKFDILLEEQKRTENGDTADV